MACLQGNVKVVISDHKQYAEGILIPFKLYFLVWGNLYHIQENDWMPWMSCNHVKPSYTFADVSWDECNKGLRVNSFCIYFLMQVMKLFSSNKCVTVSSPITMLHLLFLYVLTYSTVRKTSMWVFLLNACSKICALWETYRTLACLNCFHRKVCCLWIKGMQEWKTRIFSCFGCWNCVSHLVEVVILVRLVWIDDLGWKRK